MGMFVLRFFFFLGLGIRPIMMRLNVPLDVYPRSAHVCVGTLIHFWSAMNAFGVRVLIRELRKDDAETVLSFCLSNVSLMKQTS